jgi:hypothetical protein
VILETTSDAVSVLRSWHISSTRLTILSAPASPIQLHTEAGLVCSLSSSRLVLLADGERTSVPLVGVRFFEVASREFLSVARLHGLVQFVGFQTAAGVIMRMMERNTCGPWCW